MAAHPIVIVGDGVIEIPEGLKSDLRFSKGAQLELVPVAGVRVGDSPVQPKGDWRRLRGILKHLDVDLNAELEAERLKELAADERMIHGYGR